MIVVGTSGDDTLIGTAGDDVIQGLGGNDVLDGLTGNDQLEGGTGDDIYKIRDPDTIIIDLNGEGTDIAYAFVSYTLTAGAYIELLTTYQISATDSIDLTGNALIQTLWGNNGANTLNGGGGADTLIGFGGNDSYYLVDGTEIVIEDAGGGTDIVYTPVSYQLAAGVAVELLTTYSIAGTDAINLSGNALTQTLWGNQGANILRSGGGADTLQGFGGNDTYIISSGQERIIEANGEGTDIAYASVSYTLGAGASVELLAAESIAGTTAINLTGNELANTLWGNNGANVLNGRQGVDTMVGFGGDDTYVVNDSRDIVIENGGQGNDTINTSASYTLAAGNSIENLVGIADSDVGEIFPLSLIGNELDNNIYGNVNSDYLYGGGGSDHLYGGDAFQNTPQFKDILDGGTGADIMEGGKNDDTYYVDNFGDVVVELTNEGTDIVYASASYTLGAGTSVELLSAISIGDVTAINLKGNELVNHVWGNNGNNVIDGGAGNDILYSFGGLDTYAFTTALGATNVDRILDFTSALDKIGLDDAIFTGIGGPGALSPSVFVNGTAAGDADDRIIYDQATGNLYFDADGNGAGAHILFATLDTKPALTTIDFLVI